MKTVKSIYYVCATNPEGEYSWGTIKYTFKGELGYEIDGIGYRWDGSAWRCTDLDSGLLVKVCKCDREKAIHEMQLMREQIERKKLEAWVLEIIENLADYKEKHCTK